MPIPLLPVRAVVIVILVAMAPAWAVAIRIGLGRRSCRCAALVFSALVFSAVLVSFGSTGVINRG